jgi:hypothetical protein
MKKLIAKIKIVKMIKEKQKRKDFLMDFVAFCLNQQNKYIKINDPKEIEIYEKVIQKTLDEISLLDKQAFELRRDAGLVR